MKKQRAKSKKMSKLSDRVSLKNISYLKSGRSYMDKLFVTFTPSSKVLRFNPRMTQKLRMRTWKYVLVGWDDTEDIVVLKHCCKTELGAKRLRIPSPSIGSNLERIANTRELSVSGIAEHFFGRKVYFNTERKKDMIFLCITLESTLEHFKELQEKAYNEDSD